MKPTPIAASLLLSCLLSTAPALAASDAAAVPGKPPAGIVTPPPRIVVKSSTLPAQGLFDGEQLSASTKTRLSAIIAGAADLDVEVAFLVPTGRWNLQGKGDDEGRLTPARLRALREYLTSRGIPDRRIFVESRIDRGAKAPSLVVEMVGHPAT